MTKNLYLVFFVLTSALFAQPSNDSLNVINKLHYPVSDWVDTNAGALCSDIWGYVDSTTGKEYAIVGNYNGVLIVNITQLNQVGDSYWFSGSPSIWRDIKTFGHYAYVVHDVPSGANPVFDGLLIIDLDSLSSGRHKFIKIPIPRNNGQIDTLVRAHNIWIDDSGVLYAFGSNVGVGGAVLFDLTSDPWNPTPLSVYNNHYFHDGFARNDTLFGAALYSGVVAVDMTLKSSPTLIRSWPTPGNFCHNTWLSDDGNVLYATDELANGYISAFDISDMNNVNELFRHNVQPNTSLIPHNTHVLGTNLITSYYTFGLHILDIEFPELPVLSAYYDTSTDSAGGYSGSWGAYPYLPSGKILVSDRQEGLFVLEPEYPDVSRLHVQLGHVNYSTGGNVIYGNASGKDFVFWRNAGDTLFADDNGIVIFSSPQATNDILIYPYFGSSAPLVYDSLIVNLGSGIYPHDTLIASLFAHDVKELPVAPFQILSANKEWKLIRSVPKQEEILINILGINGQKLYSGSWLDEQIKFIPMPENSGIYIMNYKLQNGDEGAIRLYRP
ncbi:MAG: Uncharacterised protein [Owenweeksia sp. TMED14]|nr:MAG: Uncharacterised protein [Owenweeksia sp. TMED14]|tara:strand:- start:2846 stop:4507 length:1662 start_codon:yes stop_codon:yes gene_type:complete